MLLLRPSFCACGSAVRKSPCEDQRSVFAGDGSTTIVIGYVIMRLAMVTQWLRAAAADPPRRRTALRYAVGISIVQLGWLLLLLPLLHVLYA